MDKPRIGIIGLGRMGRAMAQRLSGHRFDVHGWTRSAIGAGKASELGLTESASPDQLARQADIIILALLDDAAVNWVLDALAECDIGGKLIVDTSTVSPETLRSHAAAIAQKGGALLDAPISGGPEMLLAGKVGLYVGGADVDFRRFLPVAETLSDRIHHVGGLGDGAAAKIVNNMMLLGYWQCLKEALTLGRRAGLSGETMIRILSGSPAASPAFKARMPVILGEADTVGFSVSGVVKDARLVRDLAEQLDVAIPAMSASLSSFEAAAAEGFGAADLATMVRLAVERA